MTDDGLNGKRLARRVVVAYYRQHRMNPQVTLRQMCDRYGANYQTVRNYKVEYDRRRKVQSRKKIDDQDQQNS